MSSCYNSWFDDDNHRKGALPWFEESFPGFTSLKKGDFTSTEDPMPPLLPKSDAGLANGMPTLFPVVPALLPLLLPELFGVRGGVGFPGTGL